MMDIFESAMESIRQVISRKFNNNAKAAAEAWGVSYQTLYAWIKGTRNPGFAQLSPILEQIGAQIYTPGEQFDGFAMVPKVKAKAGAGSSFVTDANVEGYYAFRHSFLDREHIHADKAEMMQVIGESMSPLIPDGATVLIDTSDREPRDGKIFVVSLDEELLVKRLQKIPSGWQLVSENKRFLPITLFDEQPYSFRIVGRVRWFGRVLD